MAKTLGTTADEEARAVIKLQIWDSLSPETFRMPQKDMVLKMC
jgi:hypothetical protein